MRAGSRIIINMVTAGVLAFGLVACSSDDENKIQDDNTAASSSSSSDASTSYSPALANKADEYVECNGEKMDLFDWSDMIMNNSLSLDNYIGKEITVVGEFRSVDPQTLYYTDAQGKKDTMSGLGERYNAPIGLMNIGGYVLVDIPENYRALVSTLKPSDVVEVHGRVSGYFGNQTLLLLPSSGAEYAGAVTIEKIS